VRRLGIRVGKWATAQEATALLQAPDASTVKARPSWPSWGSDSRRTKNGSSALSVQNGAPQWQPSDGPGRDLAYSEGWIEAPCVLHRPLAL
jgi:hypothetical protein